MKKLGLAAILFLTLGASGAASAQVSVKEAEAPGTHPWLVTKANVPWVNAFVSFAFPVAGDPQSASPEGTRLVIEHVSVQMDVAAGQGALCSLNLELFDSAGRSTGKYAKLDLQAPQLAYR